MLLRSNLQSVIHFPYRKVTFFPNLMNGRGSWVPCYYCSLEYETRGYYNEDDDDAADVDVTHYNGDGENDADAIHYGAAADDEALFAPDSMSC